MSECKLSAFAIAKHDSFKVNSVSILFGIINPNFNYIHGELLNRQVILDKVEPGYSQSNLMFILLILLLLFTAIALTNTGILLEFNARNR